MVERQEDQIYTGIDIGTTKIVTVVTKVDKDNNIEVLSVGVAPSAGMKKGLIVSPDKAMKAVGKSIKQAQEASGHHIKQAHISIAGGHIYSFNSTGVIRPRGEKVNFYDIEDAKKASKSVVLPSDREIIHVIAQSFQLDGTIGIKDPLGMYADRLEAKTHIVTAHCHSLRNLRESVEKNKVKVSSVTLQPLASGQAVLSEEEKNLGVALLDIGGGTSDLTIWNDDCPIHSQIIPLGGNHFTNDLAIGLRIPFSEAEKIKVQYGNALLRKELGNEKIQVKGLSGHSFKTIESKDIVEILQARAYELLEVVKKIITDKNMNQKIVAGYVLTGGGALLKDLDKLAEFVLEKPVRIGAPTGVMGVQNTMRCPKFATALGIIQYQLMYKNQAAEFSRNINQKLYLFQKFKLTLKNAIKEIF